MVQLKFKQLNFQKLLILSVPTGPVKLKSTHFGKYSLSPYETVTGFPMHLDEGVYKSTLLKGDILHYCQALINQFKEIDKLITDSFHSALLEGSNFKDYGLQPGDFVCHKRHQIKDSLQPCWKGLYHVLLTNPCAAKLKGSNSWIHISHLKKHQASVSDTHLCLQ